MYLTSQQYTVTKYKIENAGRLWPLPTDVFAVLSLYTCCSLIFHFALSLLIFLLFARVRITHCVSSSFSVMIILFYILHCTKIFLFLTLHFWCSMQFA